jgi:hypothetical protein
MGYQFDFQPEGFWRYHPRGLKTWLFSRRLRGGCGNHHAYSGNGLYASFS